MCEYEKVSRGELSIVDCQRSNDERQYSIRQLADNKSTIVSDGKGNHRNSPFRFFAYYSPKRIPMAQHSSAELSSKKYSIGLEQKSLTP